MKTTGQTKRSQSASNHFAHNGYDGDDGIKRISSFMEDEPHEVLGPHVDKGEKNLVVNAFFPRAKEAWVRRLDSKTAKVSMQRVDASGFFRAVLENASESFDYKLGFIDETGYASERHDPYAFTPWIKDDDIFLYGEGKHFKSYDKFGAHVTTIKGIKGVHFAVWAPNAKAVSVVGNFNHWMPGTHPMARVRYSGVWALFVPGLGDNEIYKYSIRTPENELIEKADPYAFRSELRPHTASIVTTLNGFKWTDDAWIKKREKKLFVDQPISIYEVHLGSWKRDAKDELGFINYRQLAHDLVAYVKKMGFTHIELMPINEHPLDMSWGYQVLSYFAPTSRHGTPEDFMYFVNYCHKNSIGVLLDWVPAHFPKDQHGLNNFDGRQIYAYQNWKKGEHRDWGTLVFDYGRNEVKNFLISSALFWLDKYHIDGLRVDAVASMLYLDYSRKAGEWEPNIHGGNENLEAIDFIKQFNEVMHAHHPGIVTIAEESTAFGGVSKPTYMGGLGFSMKWNMGWMHDSLEYFSKEPVYRKHHQGSITFSMMYAYTENFVLPISHDEVVHGKRSLHDKMPGDEWQKLANLKLYLAFMFTHPGKKLLFMGQEFGQMSEWNYGASLEWYVLNYGRHQHAQSLVCDLNRIYVKEKALHEIEFTPEGFEWIDFQDAENSVLSFMRYSKDRKEQILVVCNMTPVPRHDYRFGVNEEGYYKEILNTDADVYGGSGIGSFGGVRSEKVPSHGKAFSVLLQLPPLGCGVFKHE